MYPIQLLRNCSKICRAWNLKFLGEINQNVCIDFYINIDILSIETKTNIMSNFIIIKIIKRIFLWIAVFFFLYWGVYYLQQVHREMIERILSDPKKEALKLQKDVFILEDIQKKLKAYPNDSINAYDCMYIDSLLKAKQKLLDESSR